MHAVVSHVMACRSMRLTAHAVGGSGSGYISGWCDKRSPPEMSAEECRAFVHAAVSHVLALQKQSFKLYVLLYVALAGVTSAAGATSGGGLR